MSKLMNIRLTKECPAVVAMDAQAKKAVWGTSTDILLEFAQSNEGVIQPKELYDRLYQMTYDEEANERFNQLQEEINEGRVLIEEDKVFYEVFKPKYSYKPPLEEKYLQEGLALWEVELND